MAAVLLDLPVGQRFEIEGEIGADGVGGLGVEMGHAALPLFLSLSTVRSCWYAGSEGMVVMLAVLDGSGRCATLATAP